MSILDAFKSLWEKLTGTWENLSHAKKKEIIEAILKGFKPLINSFYDEYWSRKTNQNQKNQGDHNA